MLRPAGFREKEEFWKMTKKRIIIVCILVAAGIAAGLVVKARKSKKSYEITGELAVSHGNIRNKGRR